MIERGERKPYWRHTKWQMLASLIPFLILVILLPLYAETLDSARAYYEAIGFDVPYSTCLGVAHPRHSVNIELSQVEAAFEEIDHDDVDTLLHVGGSIGIADMIEPLETKFGKPVISVNQATYWFALRTYGITDPISGFGRIMLEPSIS